MFGMGECNNFGAPKKRLFGGVTGFYGPLGGPFARYSALVGGLERPFRFKWGGGGAEEYGLRSVTFMVEFSLEY